MKIALSGALGSGKSTAVRAAMSRLGWREPAGFFTHWGGAGRGAPALHLSTWTGESHPVARRFAEPAGPDELPYELDRALFNRVALASLSVSGRPVVVDELGVIELGSVEFIRAFSDVMRGSAPVLAVIQERAFDRWMRLLGRENVTHLLPVDVQTRATLPIRIASLFQA